MITMSVQVLAIRYDLCSPISFPTKIIPISNGIAGVTGVLSTRLSVSTTRSMSVEAHQEDKVVDFKQSLQYSSIPHVTYVRT